jgi:hypothetical protein
MSRTHAVSSEDVERVWKAWQARQKRPDHVRFTEERRELISKRLALGYQADDFLALIRFAYEALDDRARFWRGENAEKRTYLDLENLLRREKLGARIPVALEWLEQLANPEPDGSPPAAPATPARAAVGLTGGPLARHRSARRS